MMPHSTTPPRKASEKELQFIRKHAPKGMWKIVQTKTGKTRSQVDYQMRFFPENQDLEIVNTARELLFVNTGLRYIENGEENAT